MRDEDRIIRGIALAGEELEERRVEIVVRKGMIIAVEEVNNAPPRWICPAFFNAHTHIGDTIAMDLPCRGALEELVAPPHGLKHQLLARAEKTELVEAMRATALYMASKGTGGFADFREGGEEGVLLLREALSGVPCRPVVFGRDGGEAIADGVGISSVRDVRNAAEVVERARASGKLVALHAGERDAEDLDGAIELEPDLIVHCTHATDAHLRRCADHDIPIAVCPRSNWLLGVAGSAAYPPVKRMLELGCSVLMGTDNAMFVQPDMFRELSFAHEVYRLEPRTLLRAAIEGASRLATPHYIEEGNRACFFVIEPARSNLKWSHDICASVVKRVNSSEIAENLLFSPHN